MFLLHNSLVTQQTLKAKELQIVNYKLLIINYVIFKVSHFCYLRIALISFHPVDRQKKIPWKKNF